jgi:hypothetical protein
MLGKWKLSVDTPFGDELYTFDLFSDEKGYYGIAGNEKGFIKTTDIKVLDNKFIHWEEITETPIKAKIKFDASVEGNLMFGSIQIDEYLKVNFEGVLNESL